MILSEKFHLPHNSIRIDEFNFMLESIDLSKEYYFYEELRLHFLKSQITSFTLEIFHPKYHLNLLNHPHEEIRYIYKKARKDANEVNLVNLLNCQYTEKKSFKQVFNETVRDYTEFFAFLGLLPTYYKGRNGGEKKHYVTNRLKMYINKDLSLEDLIFAFKYRNSSKDYDSLSMYQISVRPFVIALRAINEYLNLGYEKVDNKIISAIVLYSKDENINKFISIFNDPTKDIQNYDNYFDGDFNKIKNELGRATLLLRPYLIETGYVSRKGSYYIKGPKSINDLLIPKRALFCNSKLNSITLTPTVGKVINKITSLARNNIMKCEYIEIFDDNFDEEDINLILLELCELGCISKFTENKIYINDLSSQFAINPYTDFFDINDANYVEGLNQLTINKNNLVLRENVNEIKSELESIKPIALGSDGELYEKVFYSLLKDNFKFFNVQWLGANSVGKRLSDIIIKLKINDGLKVNEIAIIIECKAGKSIKSFDERKEIDDILNTFKKEGSKVDGIWYWIVNGDSIPNMNSHGGYRVNDYSKSFIEKLSDIQFNLSEYMRVPTIVTAFSYEAIKNYLCYLYELTSEFDNEVVNKLDIPHFWRWSKKFMNLQYVMIHKEMRFDL